MKFIFVSFILINTNCLLGQEIFSYPEARKVNQTDTIFGKVIADSYRWMEKIDAEETKEWINAQQKISEKYKIGAYSSLRDYLKESSKMYGNKAFKKGCYYFNFYRKGESETSSLYFKKEIDDVSILLFAPTTIDKTAAINLDDPEISDDNSLLALPYTKNGSDWRVIRFLDIKTKTLLNDTINFVKYGDVYWYKKGVFYVSYDVKNTQESFAGRTKGRTIYYHKLGTQQKEDIIVYKPNNTLSYFDYEVTSGGKYLILYKDTTQNKEKYKTVSYIQLSDSLIFKFKILISSKKKNVYFEVLGQFAGELLVQSNINAPTGAIYSCKPDQINKLSLFVQDYIDQLNSSFIIGNKLVSAYSNDSLSFLIIRDTTGEIKKKVTIPSGYEFEYFSVSLDENALIYGFHSFFSPATVYKMNVNTYKNEPVGKTYVHFNKENIVTKKVYYYSKDSTRVPMYLTYKKGLKLNEKNPTILHGYGGFGVKTEPFFDPANVMFIKNGGVLAVPCIRGGGDFPGWHEKGRRLNKQNSFNDFIAAAEYLITKKYTSPDKIVATGASNGGLLVCAAMLQRPDLFKAIVSGAGVLDMLRFHLYNIGYLHEDEYGSIKDSADFKNLLSYSPVHNVKPDINYPATLLVAGSNDDRVNPFHSFKFLAELQKNSDNSNPYLLYYNKNTGHDNGSTSEQWLESQTYIYSFIIKCLDMEKKIDYLMDYDK